MSSAERRVSSHIMSLVGDACRQGVDLEKISIELAVHAASAALAYWPASDLHAIVDLAGLQRGEGRRPPPKSAIIIPFPRRTKSPM